MLKKLILGAAVLCLAGCTAVPAALTGASNVLSALATDASNFAGTATGTSSTVASAVSTDTTAAADATPTMASLVADVSSIVADGNLSGTQLSTAQADLSQLQKIAGAVTPASTGTQLAGALGSINGVLTDLGKFLPDVLPLLATVDNAPVGQVSIVAVVDDAAAVVIRHSDPAKIAALKAHLAAFKKIAAAKVNAGK
jgi:hypothetical protein